MAYVEVWKSGKLIACRRIEERKAQSGCRVRLGSAGEVRVAIGESKTVGNLEVRVFSGEPPIDHIGVEHTATILPEIAEDISRRAGAASAQAGNQQEYPNVEGYKIIGPLGRGGMGTVWRAIELGTKREVALKFLSTHRFDSKRSRARFEREVSLAAKLTHPNIARVYHSDLHRGVYYYAMELVDGVHLDKYVRQNELSQGEILELMRQVCDAVRHAHEHGIIHRDLKPSNILVTHDGQPHVVDFGLAKAAIKEEEDVTISIEGEVTGTLAYMSAEQAAGHIDKIGEQADVYSLGVILYELLTGRLPHDVSGSHYDVIKRIVEEDIESPREYDDTIDKDLESIVMMCLARQPEDRYPSAMVLGHDIENYLNKEPLLARSPSVVYRLRKRARRWARPIVLAACALIVIACSAGLSYYLTRFSISKRITPPVNGGSKSQVAVSKPSPANTPIPEDAIPLAKGRTPIREQTNANVAPIQPEVIAPATLAPAMSALYVNAAAKGTNDGTSWENAHNSLQDALANADALKKPVDVCVAQGVYRPDDGRSYKRGDRTASFKLAKGVRIMGGYAPDLSLRDVDAHRTILSGDLNADDVGNANDPSRRENSYHVVTGIDVDATAVLDGFTITAGNADGSSPDSSFAYGGGIFCGGNGSGPAINQCVISGNAATQSGGGLYRCSGPITNSAVTGNLAGHSGGGLHACDGQIVFCTISGNVARQGGGGLDNCNGEIGKCVVSNNVAGFGGGLSGCSGCVIECTISGNKARERDGVGGYGGGFHGCDGEIRNCTIVGNSSLGVGANAAGLAGAMNECGGMVSNCILWDNRPTRSAAVGSVPLYSCFHEDGGVGTGWIRRDPGFIGPGHWDPNSTPDDPNDDFWVDGDYHLRSDSPCIDKGNYFYCMWLPISGWGYSRVEGAQIDMGRYEMGSSMDGDGDWLADTYEPQYAGNGDRDNDGLLDGIEILGGTDPNRPDPLRQWHVPGDANSIQRALFFSRSGETIVLDKGTYYEHLYIGGRNIILTSTDPNDPNVVAATVINGDTDKDPRTQEGRVVTFRGNEDSRSQIRGLTITGGYDPSWRGGGGIYGAVCRADIINCTITGNRTRGEGGGLARCQGRISHCTVSNNNAWHGGGLMSCGGPKTNCIITGNSAQYAGGGVCECSNSMTNCIVANNTAGHDGGGLAGGVSDSESIANCTFVNNTATEFGGGISYRFSAAIVRNTIVWGNKATKGPQISLTSSNLPEMTVNYCNVQGGMPAAYVETGCVLKWADGNISVDPLFADLGKGDYHLMSRAGRWDPAAGTWRLDAVTSPCVDAGDPDSSVGAEPQPNGGRIDMGAYGGTVEASLKSQ